MKKKAVESKVIERKKRIAQKVIIYSVLAVLLVALFIRCEAGSEFDYETMVPGYCGCPYVEINNNVPFFSKEDVTDKCYEYYSPLDKLGRCGYAMACVGTETLPAEDRGSIGNVKPSGWHTVTYPEIISDRYLYNRCHLIGYQLTAENANEKNLITGTRYLNIEGMLPFEDEVAAYVSFMDRHVVYRVTPVFVGDELIARGVLIEAKDYENNGNSIQFCVFCYNVQPKIGIDYLTGDSWVETDITADSDDKPKEAEKTHTYILNTSTKKIHKPSCSSVAKIKPGNCKETTDSVENLIARGYAACKSCNPK